MTRTLCFIDESGNHDLDIGKSGSTNYFLILAIIIDEDQIEVLSQEIERLRLKHFQKGEIKSSSVKDKDGHSRRVRILSDIMSLEFKFYFLALDKSSVEKDSGLKFKQSFIKFSNKILYSSIASNFNELEFFADSHGNTEFQRVFHDYILSLWPDDLFKHKGLSLVDSKEYPLVQLADFIVGSLAKFYEKRKVNENLASCVKELFLSKAIGVIEWPVKYRELQADSAGGSKDDSIIYSHALRRADDFLAKKAGVHDFETANQLAVLNYLLFNDKFHDSNAYVSASEIIEHLGNRGFGSISEQTLRSSIIAKLRDNGVIIASSNRGYKIPNSVQNLTDYASRVNSQVIPLLNRLNRARNSYLLATKGDFDLLEPETFSHLRDFISLLSETEFQKELE